MSSVDPSGSPPPVSPPPPPPSQSSNSSSQPSDSGSAPPSDSSSAPVPSDSGVLPSNSATTPSATSLSVPLTTAVVTSVVFTSNGQKVTQLSTSATTIPPGATITLPPSTKSSSTNNTGAIVGGAVGGVAFLALLVIITALYLRRQRQKRIERAFDGDFDPTKTSMSAAPGSAAIAAGAVGAMGGKRNSMAASAPTLPNVRVDDDDGMGGRLAGTEYGGGIVSPYVLSPQTQAIAPSVYGNMSQGFVGAGYSPYHPSNYASSAHSASHPSLPNPHPLMVPGQGLSPSHSGSGSGTPPSTHRSGSPTNTHYTSSSAGAPLMGGARSGPMSTISSSNYPQSQNTFMLANPDPNAAGGSAIHNNPNKSQPLNTRGGGPVTVHQDAGRVPQQDENEGEESNEIPPTYDSIPRD